MAPKIEAIVQKAGNNNMTIFLVVGILHRIDAIVQTDGNMLRWNTTQN